MEEGAQCERAGDLRQGARWGILAGWILWEGGDSQSWGRWIVDLKIGEKVVQPCREKAINFFCPSSDRRPTFDTHSTSARVARSASTVASPVLFSRHLWRASKPRALRIYFVATMASAAASPSPAPGGAVEGSLAAPPTTKPKKLHGRAFYESIGSPKYIVAPMVDQSEYVRSLPPRPPRLAHF